jgi:hypothetical protein
MNSPRTTGKLDRFSRANICHYLAGFGHTIDPVGRTW